MEAVGAGANVLAFVVVGLNCAKLIHGTLSAVNDGPAIVQLLANDMLQLQGILEQLSQSRAIANNTALGRAILQCAENLRLRAASIEKLQVAPKDKATGRFWKRLKGVVSESELHRIRSEVIEMVAVLNLRLTGLSSNAIYEVKDGIDGFQQQITSFASSMQKQFDLQAASFLGIEKNLVSGQVDHHNTLQTGFSKIQQTMEKVESTTSICAQDTSSIHDLLKEIKDHLLSNSKTNESGVSQTGIDAGRAGTQPVSDPGLSDSDQMMLECIDRLSSLVDEKREAIDVYSEDDDQAESVIQDLQSVLRRVQDQNCSISQTSSEISLRGSPPEPSFLGHLRRFGRYFGTGELSINSRVDQGRPLSKVLDQTRTLNNAATGIGTFSLMVNKRKRSVSGEEDANIVHSRNRHRTDYTMSLTFLPNGSRNHMLVASVSQREMWAGCVSSISRLQVNRVLPKDSLVFRIVEKGDVRELQEMFQTGEASLQDHDEYGASLLFYATQQPAMCRFLIDNGLDVNEVAETNPIDDPCPILDREMLSLLQMHHIDLMTMVSEPERLGPILECYKLLLRAGADPTINMAANMARNPDRTSFLEHVAVSGYKDPAQIAWNPEFAGPYADINSYRDEEGRTSILMACRYDLNKEVCEQLLAAGANIHDRDNDGNTCLHLCLQGLIDEPSYTSDAFDIVKFFIANGADTRAVNDKGTSVSDIAYISGHPGGFGDIWDAALQSCGYDIAEFRSRHQRRAMYTRAHYTRQDFEELWEGMEDKCPYWDDEPWPHSQPEPCHPSEPDDDSDPGLDVEEDGWVNSESLPSVGNAWDYTQTLPDGEPIHGMANNGWQDSDHDLAILGTPLSLSMDLENPWL